MLSLTDDRILRLKKYPWQLETNLYKLGSNTNDLNSLVCWDLRTSRTTWSVGSVGGRVAPAIPSTLKSGFIQRGVMNIREGWRSCVPPEGSGGVRFMCVSDTHTIREPITRWHVYWSSYYMLCVWVSHIYYKSFNLCVNVGLALLLYVCVAHTHELKSFRRASY